MSNLIVLGFNNQADAFDMRAALAKACPKNTEFSTYEHGEVWNGSVRDAGSCCGGQDCRFSGEFRGCGDTAFVTSQTEDTEGLA
jgi:hypothetical protein